MSRVVHAGWCDGGPLAGQRLAHDAPRYRVPIRRFPVLSPPDWVPTTETIVVGEYVWDEGAWRWRGPT